MDSLIDMREQLREARERADAEDLKLLQLRRKFNSTNRLFDPYDKRWVRAAGLLRKLEALSAARRETLAAMDEAIQRAEAQITSEGGNAELV